MHRLIELDDCKFLSLHSIPYSESLSKTIERRCSANQLSSHVPPGGFAVSASTQHPARGYNTRRPRRPHVGRTKWVGPYIPLVSLNVYPMCIGHGAYCPAYPTCAGSSFFHLRVCLVDRVWPPDNTFLPAHPSATHHSTQRCSACLHTVP